MKKPTVPMHSDRGHYEVANRAVQNCQRAVYLPDWKIGENVPWTVSWTGEDSYDLFASPTFHGYVDLVQVQRPGDGAPRFAAVHITRQRLGLLGQLCHVCGRRTPARDRYIFPVESGGFVAVGNAMRYAGTVPPVHLACGRRARQLCPHLSHVLAEPVAFPSEDGEVVPHPGIPAGMEALAKTLPPRLKIVFAYLRLYGSRFSCRVERMRKERGGRMASSWTAFTA
jgi:hypothetical protein